MKNKDFKKSIVVILLCTLFATLCLLRFYIKQGEQKTSGELISYNLELPKEFMETSLKEEERNFFEGKCSKLSSYQLDELQVFLCAAESFKIFKDVLKFFVETEGEEIKKQESIVLKEGLKVQILTLKSGKKVVFWGFEKGKTHSEYRPFLSAGDLTFVYLLSKQDGNENLLLLTSSVHETLTKKIFERD